MEGALVAGAVTGAMKTLLPKLAALLERQYKLCSGVRKQITSMRNELSSMNALLVKLALMEKLDAQLKDWRDKVRELSYDVEDCIDIFTNELDGGDGKGWGNPKFKKLKARYKIAYRIEELKDRVKEVSKCVRRYNFDERIACPSQGPVAIDPRVTALYAPARSLVGMDGPKEKLTESLRKEAAEQLKVVAVVGFGGMGKTTLVKQVYDEIKSQFDSTAFISMSQNPNIVHILRGMVKAMSSYSASSDDERDLIDTLKTNLTEERYLIVIDDLWSTEAWNTIKSLFVENNRGSRVIVTTRIEDVAQECCSCFHGHVYKIKPLNDLDSGRLFHRRIFHSEDACPEHLKNVSDEILKKCGGCPLAILSVASILRSHEEANSMDIWERIQKNLGLQLEENHAFHLMRHVLNLGYNDLSLDLRTCLLYLVIFPEDSEINKDDLTKRWIAEGFVTGKHGYGPQEIAESCFNELTNKHMIQIAEFDDCGHVLSCKVHDIMLEFIKLKTTEENFITIMNDLHSTKGCLPVRRLSLQVSNSECNQVQETMPLTQARSFNFWGPAGCIPPLSKFRLLRVLHLDVSDSKDEQYDLSSICDLLQLKYLRIIGIGCKKLLKKLRKLQHLQTLEIVPHAFENFDLNFCELPLTLLHLIVPSYAKLVGEIGRMRSVRSLATIRLDLENIESLGELSNLRELELELELPYDDYMGAYYSSLLSSLCKLGICNLQSLIISSIVVSCDVLTYWSPPPCHLRRLHVPNCRFSMIPDWIAQLYKLRSLEFQVLSLSIDGAEVLARLPFLVHLNLVVKHVPEEGITIHSMWFPNLKKLSFRYKVLCFTFEAGAMPRLQSLYLQCELDAQWERQDDGVLTGIEHLGSLKAFQVLVSKHGGIGQDSLMTLCNFEEKDERVESLVAGIGQDSLAAMCYFEEMDESVESLEAGIGQGSLAAMCYFEEMDESVESLEAGIGQDSLAAMCYFEEKDERVESLEAAIRKAIKKHPESPDIRIISY